MTSEFAGPVIYRQFQGDADRSYVAATWVSSLRSDRWGEARDAGDGGDRSTYHGMLVDRLLANPDTLIFVACLEAAPDTIVGYCVGSRITAGARSSVLHYVYVRKQRRRENIAHRLLGWCDVKTSAPLVHTFQTQPLNWMKHLFPTAVYVDPEDFLR